MTHRSLIAILTVMSARTVCAAPVVVVRDGEPLAAIVVSPNAPDPIRRAVGEMISSVKEKCGATLPTANAPLPGKPSIHVGETAYVKSLGIDLSGKGTDAYVIRSPAPDTIVILGASPYGTAFGVYAFLERYLDVRWLLPGRSGRDVPPARTLVVDVEDSEGAPTFISRLFSGGRGAHVDWAGKNGMHGTIKFHHNLRNLYKPEAFAVKHPDFYPLWDGERFRPLENTNRWQPCFTAPGIVEAGIKRITEYFDAHPDAISYSLGVNDTRRHCECESCQALDPGRKNFLGIPHLSDRYFTWANAVVEGVLEKHPDKYFGCLAYNCVVEPPDRVKVHERIIPYMTYDRMKWIHPEIQKHGQELTESWAKMSPTLGWYDYIYGTPYCLPRYYPHKMAEYLRWGYEHGVRALYAEAYPNFGEGPKLYVYLALNWDPYVDVDKLLDEWFTRCCGPESGPALRKYYEFWEDFWTRRILDSAWFSEGGQYLRFNSPAYVRDVSIAEIAQCRTWLEEAVTKARTDKQRARGELLLRAFEYYEATALAYPRADDSAAVPATEKEALALLDDEFSPLSYAQKRLNLVLEFEKDPVLVHPLPPTRYGTTSGASWGSGRLWRVFEWVRRSDAVRECVAKLAAHGKHETVRESANLLLKVATGESLSLNEDPSFEEGEDWPTAWSKWVKFGIGRNYRSTEVAHTGKASLCFDGMKRGGPHQTLVLEPGRYAVTAFVYVPKDIKKLGTVEVGLTPRDAKNANLPGRICTQIVPVRGRWQPLAAAGTIPAKIGHKEVAKVMLIPIIDGWDPDGKVYLDDLSLMRLE